MPQFRIGMVHFLSIFDIARYTDFIAAWSCGNTDFVFVYFIANPKVSLIGNISYSVNVETHNGCVATATANLEPDMGSI